MGQQRPAGAADVLAGAAMALAWKTLAAAALAMATLLLVVVAALCAAYANPAAATGAVVGGAVDASLGWVQDRLGLTREEPAQTQVGGSGPVYFAGTTNLKGGVSLRNATIHDLGLGPSDAGRVERMIRAINPGSPLAGHGEHILAAGQQFRVDPLLIAQWQLESGMATTGINSPANGGNMTWDAAREATRLYGCTAGPASLGHLWAKCPTVPAGLSLWHDYVGTYYPAREIQRFDLYVNAYNPCSDSARYGFICGSEYGLEILKLIKSTAGTPVATVAAGGDYYRYQGEPSSVDRYGNEQANCGPASAAMAIQYAKGLAVPVRDIRTYIVERDGPGGVEHGEYTDRADLTAALARWGVRTGAAVDDAADIRAAVRRGGIALVLLRMGGVSPGADYAGVSADPARDRGRYYGFVGAHWIVVKGVSADGRWLVVNDPNVWGGPGDAGYWYSDGSPKGRDRLYPASEVEAGMRGFTPGYRGVEVLPPPQRSRASAVRPHAEPSAPARPSPPIAETSPTPPYAGRPA